MTLHETSARAGTEWVIVSADPEQVVPWTEPRAEGHRRLLRRSRRHCGYAELRAQPHSPHERIVLASDRDGDFEIFVMDVDGSDLRQITSNDVDDVRPDWAPDGRRIVFSRMDRLRIANVDKGTDCPLGFFGRKVKGTHPAWSPDGRWIAYSSGDCYGSAVIATRLDGARQAWFADGYETWVALDPTWKPHGRSLVYQDHDESAVVIEKRRHAREYKQRSLFRISDGIRGPVSSPDGSMLLFSGGWDGGFDHDMPHTDFRLMVFSGGQKRVVDAGDGWSSLPGSWSPDGSRIVMYNDRTGSFDIYTIGLQGEALTRLTDHPANDITPDWSS